jgi:plasmid stabilization system protein ParE
MSKQVVISDRAARDLEEAYLWIAKQAAQPAVRWYNVSLDALSTLSSCPERCSLAAGNRKSPAEIRQLLYGRRGSNRALFTIQHQTVVVLHIRHTARRDASPEELL